MPGTHCCGDRCQNAAEARLVGPAQHTTHSTKHDAAKHSTANQVTHQAGGKQAAGFSQQAMTLQRNCHCRGQSNANARRGTCRCRGFGSCILVRVQKHPANSPESLSELWMQRLLWTTVVDANTAHPPTLGGGGQVRIVALVLHCLYASALAGLSQERCAALPDRHVRCSLQGSATACLEPAANHIMPQNTEHLDFQFF